MRGGKSFHWLSVLWCFTTCCIKVTSCKDWNSGDCHPENLAFVILLINAVLQQLPMLKDWDAHRWSVSVCSFCFHKYLFPQSAENPIERSPRSCGLLLRDHTQVNKQSNIWYFWTFVLDFFPKIHVELAWCWVSWWEQSLISSYGKWIFWGQFSTPKVHSILFHIIRAKDSVIDKATGDT